MSFRAKQISERLRLAIEGARADKNAADRPPGAFQEKRLAVRIVVDLAVTYEAAGTTDKGRVTELSRSGLRLRTTRALSTLSEIAITFGPTFPAKNLRIKARVIRQSSADGAPLEFGLQIMGGNETKAAVADAVLKLSIASKANHR